MACGDEEVLEGNHVAAGRAELKIAGACGSRAEVLAGNLLVLREERLQLLLERSDRGSAAGRGRPASTEGRRRRGAADGPALARR